MKSRRKSGSTLCVPVTPKCVGAIRGSTDKQQLTLPTQGAAITRYCQHRGLDLLALFVDSGTCGKSPWLQRDNVQEMLEFMADNGVQQIIYTRLDRAFRSTTDAILTLNECAKHGISIHFCEQMIDPTTPMGQAMLAIIAVFAELETNLRAQRQAEVFDTMRTSQFKAGINVPYGWDKTPSATRKTRAARREHDLAIGNDTAFDLVPNWDEQGYLVEILRRSEGGESDGDIARLLNAADVPTKNGKRWHGSTVYSVRSYARIAESVAGDAGPGSDADGRPQRGRPQL